MRSAQITRRTAETDIRLSLSLDDTGRVSVQTGVGFLDHMLTLFARHGRFSLAVTCQGDTQVDDHHSVEDVGIALGEAVVGIESLTHDANELRCGKIKCFHCCGF